jgi:hypothetical protein
MFLARSNLTCTHPHAAAWNGMTKLARFGAHHTGKTEIGGPDRTRTCGLRFRKPLLCPAELRDRVARSIPQIARNWSLREGSDRFEERPMIQPFASRLQDVDTGHKERPNVGWHLPAETQPITFSRFHRKLSRSLMPSPARHARSAPRPIALKAGQRAGHWGAAWRYRVVY